MTIIYMLITCSLLLAIFFLLVFIWSVKSGQMDDDYTPAVRILFEDKIPAEESVERDQAVKDTN